MEANKIEVYDDLLNESLINEILNVTRRIGFRYGWQSNKQVSFSHWNVALSRTGTNSSNRKDIRGELPPPVLKLWESFQPTLLPNTPVLIRTYSNGYTYGNDGYIHQDSQAPEDMSAIVYMNKEWNANYAGETAIFDSTGEIIRSVLPKWRRLLIFPSNMHHVGRGVSRICPLLRNVLVFKARPLEEVKVDASRVNIENTLLEAGIDNTSMPKTLEQLLKNYDNLKNWNCSPPVCFAGALYVLYLPEAQLTSSFADVVRPKILDLYGIEADRLAKLFSSVDLVKLVADGNAVDKTNGSEITLEPNDKQYLMLFQTASLLDSTPVVDPKEKIANELTAKEENR